MKKFLAMSIAALTGISVVPLIGSVLLGGVIGLSTGAIYAPPANADTVNCYNNSFGTSCTGSNGTTNCYDNSFGKSCTGPNGTTNCYNNSFGTSCTGTSGSYNCYDNSFGTSCSGSGIGVIPKPTPTPSKTYFYVKPTPTPTKTYVYVNPTPTAASKNVSTKKVCVTSSGLSENCSTYPDFYMEYCSASSGGPLQWKNGNTWEKLWDITGRKDSRCKLSSNPYLTIVKGRLTGAKGLSLRVVGKPVNKVIPTPDLFIVKVK
jgi:hypothetical protein